MSKQGMGGIAFGEKTVSLIQTGSTFLANKRGIEMASEIEDLKKRVEQLEKALWAVVFNKPTGCDKDGRIMALPFVRTSSPPGTMPVYGSKPVED